MFLRKATDRKVIFLSLNKRVTLARGDPLSIIFTKMRLLSGQSMEFQFTNCKRNVVFNESEVHSQRCCCSKLPGQQRSVHVFTDQFYNQINLLVKSKRFKEIAWIQSHHPYLEWKFKSLAGKFARGYKAKHCWVMSTNFWMVDNA